MGMGCSSARSPQTLFPGYRVDTDIYVNDSPDQSTPPSIWVESGCDLDKPGHSDFSDRCGHVFAIRLPAGEYYISRWGGRVGTSMSGPSAWKPVSFTIEAGRATYIGNIHIKVIPNTETFLGKHSIGGA